MTAITVLGGTGYAGSAIVKEAAKRGHQVISLSRTAPTEAIDGVKYIQGSALDDVALGSAIEGASVIIASISPRGDMAGKVYELYQKLALRADALKARLVIVGGFSGLRPAPGAPRFVEGDIPPEYASEINELFAVYQWLVNEAPESLDWLYVSPAAEFGSYAPGEATGKYRVGGEVALFDENGKSAISAPDFALGVIDEVLSPAHHREIISLAY